MDWGTIIITISPLVSAILVALLNNWDKINPSKRRVNEMHKSICELQQSLEACNTKFQLMCEQMDTVSSAQKISLQTRILEFCKTIQDCIKANNNDYAEELKQLIILYREYYLCGYNSQGRLYFNDTLDMVAKHNNVLAHELMTTYFSEYDPNRHHGHTSSSTPDKQ